MTSSTKLQLMQLSTEMSHVIRDIRDRYPDLHHYHVIKRLVAISTKFDTLFNVATMDGSI